MKYLLMFLLLAPVTFGQSIVERVAKFDKPKDYQAGYDKFKKLTTVIVDPVYLDPKQKGWKAPQTAVYLLAFDDGDNSFGFHFSGPLFSDDTLRFLLDGELLEIKDDTIGYSTIVAVTPGQMEKIVNAKVVELQIHGIEGKISEKDMVRLKNLFSLTKPQ